MRNPGWNRSTPAGFSWGTGLPVDFLVQPGPGVSPVAVRRGHGDAERPRRLLDRQPGEVAQLDELGLDRILLLEPAQRLVERQQLFPQFGRCQFDGVEVVANQPAAALVAA